MNNMRDILDLINEMSEEEGSVELHDEFDIELSEEVIIESGVIDINEDGILIEGDEKSLQLLEEHGLILEDADWSKYDEPTVSRVKKGVTKLDRTDYNVPPAMRKDTKGKPGYELRKDKLKDMGALKSDVSENSNSYESMSDSELLKLCYQAGIEKSCVRDGEGGLANRNEIIDMLNKEGLDESGLQAYLGKKKYGEKGMKALQKAGREGAGKEEMAKLRAKYDKLDEFMDTGSGDGSGGDDDMKDRIIQMYKEDGLREVEIAKLEGISELEVHKIIDAHERGMDEAKYQGREVPLGKPMAGDVKKRKVYVKKPNGKVVKVNFGDKKMRIKKSNPKRRKSFRARHNCKNPGPRWKARYWSCRAW